MIRQDGRSSGELRKLKITKNYIKYAEGSCLVELGHTKVIATASVEDGVPHFLRGSGNGWVTAEYGMIPRSCKSRVSREASKGKLGGRTHEIQRLIGRSLRSVTDMTKLGERTIWLDCDVIQADGGTRCAAITGGYVALALAVKKILSQRLIEENPLNGAVCAISCGIFNGEVVADLDYAEDSKCDVDANFVINKNFDLIEIQGTTEQGAMSFTQISKMYDLAKKAAEEIFALQQKAIDGHTQTT